ncbi:DUF7409 domain-containing protein [Haloferacaceae archaeon DSL9]
MTDEGESSDIEDGDATSVRFVGPATAAIIADADFDLEDLRRKRISYRTLIDAGVNPGVAAKLRREHSLSWSFRSGDDLARRSTQVRGLGAAEAAWVAASSGDWERETETDAGGATDEAAWVAASGRGETAAETDGSGAAAEEAVWRARSRPTPVTELDGVDEAAAARLAEAGVTSVRSLATACPERVADVLGLDRADVRAWHDAANEQYE